MKKWIKRGVKTMESTIKKVFQKSIRFGGLKIRKGNDSYVTTFSHRGNKIQISSENLNSLKDTLVELKKVRLSQDEILARLRGKEILRLYQCWTSHGANRKIEKSGDGNLLLLGLVTSQYSSLQNARGVDEWELHLTEIGQTLCAALFFDISSGPKRDRHNLYAFLWRPLLAYIMRGEVYEAKDYKECLKYARGGDPDWPWIKTYLIGWSKKSPGYRELLQWHYRDYSRRQSLMRIENFNK